MSGICMKYDMMYGGFVIDLSTTMYLMCFGLYNVLGTCYLLRELC